MSGGYRRGWGRGLLEGFLGDGAFFRDGEEKDERTPVRPALPFLLLPVVAMWVAMRLSEQLVFSQFSDSGVFSSILEWLAMDGASALGLVSVAISLCVLGALLGIAGVASAIIRRCCSNAPSLNVHALAIACGFALGMVVGCSCWGSFSSGIGQVSSSGSGVTWTVEVRSDRSITTSGSYSIGEAVSDDGRSVTVQILWDDPDDALPYGARFETKSSPSPISSSQSSQWMFENLIGARLQAGEVGEWEWSGGILGALGSLRYLCGEIIRTHPGEGAELLAGIVLGDSTGLDSTRVEASFRSTGLVHLIAVSGGHMAVVTMLITWMLGAFRVPRHLSTVALCTIVCAYLVLTAMQPSAVRSCIMSVMASVSWIAGRRSGALHTLVGAVALMLVVDPSNAFSLGFALSVFGVGSLALFLELADSWMRTILPSALLPVSQPMAMTLVAQAATTPVTVPAFSMISLGAPLCNLVASPVMTFLLGGGLVSLFVCAIAPPVGAVMIGVMCAVSELAVWAVDAMASLPAMAIPAHLDATISTLVAVVACALLWAVWPLPTRRRATMLLATASAAIALVAIVLGAPREPEVVVMDVGQGDAILVRNGTSAILVDTGQYGQELLDALGRNGVSHLDAVVLTHFDADHCGALGDLESLVSVDSVLVARGSVEFSRSEDADYSAITAMENAEALCGENGIVEIGVGDELRLSDEMVLTVMWPQDAVESSENSESLCLLLECRGTTMLLTGDAEADELAKIYGQGLGEIDILKVGHHGSADSVDETTMDELDPDAALISVGEQNRYGHPSSETLEVLEEQGIAVFRTDLNGDIRITFGESGARISCANI